MNHELKLLGLKNKLRITMKYFLINTPQTELSCFYKILELLKQKYPDTDDTQFINNIRIHIDNNNNKNNITHATISNVALTINNCKHCNNLELLEDLLDSVSTGINIKLEHHHN